MRKMAFDYVIVGGGAAGCVLAARLAAESNRSVALLERGRQNTNQWIHIPAIFFKALESHDADVVVSDPDPTLGSRPFPVPQGNVLGGGSSVNSMIYMRGQHQNYDDWADLHGCTGWRFDDVLPIFKRQEANTRLADPYHGKAGRLVVTDPATPHPVSAIILEAARSAGLPETDDFNGERQDGAGWYQVTASGGLRQSSATCFLLPELGRENLTVLTSHLACRIRVEARRAVAVEARDEPAGEVLIQAHHQIILTAGSFHSPKLLMLTVCQTMSIKCIFRNVDTNGIVHVSFPPCLVIRAQSPSIRSGHQKRRGRPYSSTVHNDQEGNDPTLAVAGINAVPDDGSCIAQEPRYG